MDLRVGWGIEHLTVLIIHHQQTHQHYLILSNMAHIDCISQVWNKWEQLLGQICTKCHLQHPITPLTPHILHYSMCAHTHTICSLAMAQPPPLKNNALFFRLSLLHISGGEIGQKISIHWILDNLNFYLNCKMFRLNITHLFPDICPFRHNWSVFVFIR